MFFPEKRTKIKGWWIIEPIQVQASNARKGGRESWVILPYSELKLAEMRRIILYGFVWHFHVNCSFSAFFFPKISWDKPKFVSSCGKATNWPVAVEAAGIVGMVATEYATAPTRGAWALEAGLRLAESPRPVASKTGLSGLCQVWSTTVGGHLKRFLGHRIEPHFCGFFEQNRDSGLQNISCPPKHWISFSFLQKSWSVSQHLKNLNHYEDHWTCFLFPKSWKWLNNLEMVVHFFISLLVWNCCLLIELELVGHSQPNWSAAQLLELFFVRVRQRPALQSAQLVRQRRRGRLRRRRGGHRVDRVGSALGQADNKKQTTTATRSNKQETSNSKCFCVWTMKVHFPKINRMKGYFQKCYSEIRISQVLHMPSNSTGISASGEDAVARVDGGDGSGGGAGGTVIINVTQVNGSSGIEAGHFWVVQIGVMSFSESIFGVTTWSHVIFGSFFWSWTWESNVIWLPTGSNTCGLMGGDRRKGWRLHRWGRRWGCHWKCWPQRFRGALWVVLWQLNDTIWLKNIDCEKNIKKLKKLHQSGVSFGTLKWVSSHRCGLRIAAVWWFMEDLEMLQWHAEASRAKEDAVENCCNLEPGPLSCGLKLWRFHTFFGSKTQNPPLDPRCVPRGTQASSVPNVPRARIIRLEAKSPAGQVVLIWSI